MAKKKWTAAEKKAFAEKMRKARAAKARKTNPKKRGVPARKKASQKRSARIAKQTLYRIMIKGHGQKGYWTGKDMDARLSFDTVASRAKDFSTKDAAIVMAHQIRHKPPGYNFYVETFSKK